MAQGRFNGKQITFNETQIAKIREHSIEELHNLTGIAKSNCFFIRSNRPQDYRYSTLNTLARGMGMKVGEFVDLDGGPVIMDPDQS